MECNHMNHKFHEENQDGHLFCWCDQFTSLIIESWSETTETGKKREMINNDNNSRLSKLFLPKIGAWLMTGLGFDLND